ncbi:hypothetical protein J5Y05_12185 [Streptomyces sp. RG38]|uniref:Lipoprotein CseA n=1 Tax=Streptomyces tagetis TaxID=2820809 RepID=A0A940XF08_9ACTN|nr:hypothetical protein [Streptomyces sp. RG38]
MSAGRTLGGTGRTAGAASATVVVFVALGVLLSGCGAGGTGARDEGPAHAEAAAGVATASPVATPSPVPTPSGVPDRVDAVRLVKSDPRVSTAVKRELKPCVADEYPVDVSYGDLTDGVAQDVVVNVLTCGDAVGVGSYVYREQDGGYRNVFRSEEPPVYAEIDRGDLVVTKQVYERGDPVSDPSGENVITYRWSADHFTEEHRTHNDYSNAVGTVPSPVPAP